MERTFSNKVRSELHFSATLLPYLLLANNYAGMRALFRSIEPFKDVNLDSDEIEIVTELYPIRDVGDSQGDETVKESVPDLFLRIGRFVLLIEAKFFTFPAEKEVVEQIKAQREAIEHVRPLTGYDELCEFHYLALTVHDLGSFSSSDTDMSHMTWDKVIDVIKPVINDTNSEETIQVLNDLACAINRANEEKGETGAIDYEICDSIQELVRRGPELLENGYFYVGFQGRSGALQNARVDQLEKRHHYKYSRQPWSKNWLPMEEVISHYLKLKAKDAKGRLDE